MSSLKLLFAALVASLVFASAARADDDLLERVKERGTLRVCTINYTPWNILNPVDNSWTGLNVDIVAEITKGLEVKVEWVDSAWSTIIQNLKSDKCDLGAAALWTSTGRASNVSFTRPIGGDGSTLFVPEDSAIASYEEIDKAGNIITVLSGSADEKLAKEKFKNAEVKSLVTDQVAAHILEVASGRANAAFGGFAGNAQFISNNPNIKVKPLPDLLVNFVPFAYAVPAKEYFFRDFVNIVISNLESTGKLDEIKNRWIKKD
ncbi:polar amino acid transport system substrate-binding protein [Rhodoligotrophos appendicifer]|uniref:substrate-binding periplasmic protein n=1 Tax=Rhodoligotrophos appendicifer TaxID=987056 RepID=UPI001184885E|nr:ABC transporter substrate-binding protein [Rhodoligotrophos appendicifer]